MSLASLLEAGYLRPHSTSRSEVRAMFKLVERDLADAAVEGLSTDRHFLIAYEAALNLATIALYCAGYETHGKGITGQHLRPFLRSWGISSKT